MSLFYSTVDVLSLIFYTSFIDNKSKGLLGSYVIEISLSVVIMNFNQEC